MSLVKTPVTFSTCQSLEIRNPSGCPEPHDFCAVLSGLLRSNRAVSLAALCLSWHTATGSFSTPLVHGLQQFHHVILAGTREGTG